MTRLLIPFTLLTQAIFAHPSDIHISTTATKTSSPSLLGHNNAKYQVIADWAKVTPEVAPVINSHALAESKEGEIYLVTDHPENAFLVFKPDGTFVRSFGKGLVGGHGIDFWEKDGVEYLVHVDCGWHFEAEGWKAKPTNGRVTILKKDGTIVRKLPTPMEIDEIKLKPKKFMPCDVAITPPGNILIADGYGSDMIYEMTFDGEFVKQWGGPSKGEDSLKNAHGISLDLSNPNRPLAWVPSRSQSQMKAFTLDGEHVETIHLPGALAGQLFFRGDRIYTAVCWSNDKDSGKRLNESGFIIILDRNTKKVISAPGGSKPTYLDDKLQPLHQTTKTFIHGHDLYVDKKGAIYVGEWNANRRYPMKLVPTQ